MSDVTQLAALAANAEPPALDELSARRMIERALAAPRIGEARIAEPARRRRIGIAVPVFAVAALALLAFLWLRPTASPPTAPLLRLALPTGDQLTATSGAQFEIAELAPASRRLRMQSGSILFSVAHVVPGQHFDVTTPHAVVRAKGTVFSVTIDHDATSVFVVQGVVEIDHGNETHVLPAGQSWHGAAPSTAVTSLAQAPRVAPTEPAPAPAPAPAPTIEPPSEPGATGDRPEPAEPRPQAEPSVEPARPPAPSIARARAHIIAGRFEAALAEARRAETTGTLTGAWHVVIGDAHRGLGHASDAADAFAKAVTDLSGDARAEAAYSAAYLRFRELRDTDGALAALTAGDVEAEGSVLEERGLALRAQILESIGRRADARPIAERYLARFPHGGLASFMRSLLRR
jgi:hypothetical protein